MEGSLPPPFTLCPSAYLEDIRTPAPIKRLVGLLVMQLFAPPIQKASIQVVLLESPGNLFNN